MMGQIKEEIMYALFKNGLSLKTQVYGLITLLAVVSFSVRIITDVDTTREYLETQMASHAQDTATSLGLSISEYLDEDNLVIAKTMAQAIFDSGYYQTIKFTDVQGNVIFELNNPKSVESVPDWFISLSTLTAPTMTSELNNGWVMAGTLSVTSHTAQSYLTLWKHTKNSIIDSLILLLASLIVAYFILREVFKPLIAVEQQALLVTKKRFTLNPEVPVAKELRTVTKAINNMVMNLQRSFDSLTKQTQALTQEVYIDLLTNLGNRKSFENHFHSIRAENTLTAMMITLPSLNNVNNSMSYQEGDKYVKEVASCIIDSLSELDNSKVFRLNGSTFIVLAHYDAHFLQRTCITLTDSFDQYRNQDIHVEGYANIGIMSIKPGATVSDLLSSLDTSCTLDHNKAISHETTDNDLFSVQQWRELIQEIIHSGEINFSVQPIKKAKTQTTQCYFEVFANFIHKGQKINNGHLFTMAEKLNLTEELDKKLIRDFCVVKEDFPNDIFALNLTKNSLYSNNFIEWLSLFSQTKPILKSNLVLEINEISLLYNVQVASSHIDIIKELGINICIEHFGTSLTSFRYLQGLDIEYVKIDGSYIQDLTENTQSQFFIQTVISICHGFGIKVLGCLVEKEQTLQILEELGCDAIQGNLVLPPTAIEKKQSESMNNKFTFCPDTLKFCN